MLLRVLFAEGLACAWSQLCGLGPATAGDALVGPAPLRHGAGSGLGIAAGQSSRGARQAGGVTTLPAAAVGLAAHAEAREEGWLWWFVLVGGVLVAFGLLMVLRRRLVRPMPHRPSDTTDSWAEAGRRLCVPPPKDSGQAAGDGKESP